LKDLQVCLDCGLERQSKVSFDSPRYHRTQDGVLGYMCSDVQTAPCASLAENAALASEAIAADGAGALAMSYEDAPEMDVRQAIPAEMPAYS
jgi:hypothetical protein